MSTPNAYADGKKTCTNCKRHIPLDQFTMRPRKCGLRPLPACRVCMRLRFHDWNRKARGEPVGNINAMNLPRDPTQAAIALADMVDFGPITVFRFESGAIQMRRTGSPPHNAEMIGVYDLGCDWRNIAQDLAA